MQIPKIKDRLTLGVIAGLVGNIPKLLLCSLAVKMGWVEISCQEKAASLLVQKKQLNTPMGNLVGYITDTTLAGLLGVAYTYGLTISGKNNALLKGAFLGLPTWIILTSLSSVMDAKEPKLSPKTVLNKFIISGVHGATSCYLITKLGDNRLFKEKTSINVSNNQNAALQPELEKGSATIGDIPPAPFKGLGRKNLQGGTSNA